MSSVLFALGAVVAWLAADYAYRCDMFGASFGLYLASCACAVMMMAVMLGHYFASTLPP